MSEQKLVSVNGEDDNKQVDVKEARRISLGRHQAQCSICKSPYRQQIEQDWINWHSPMYFKEFFGIERDTLYRHAHAFNLFPKRRRNITMICEKMMERVDLTCVSGSEILNAAKLCQKINSAELTVEQVQAPNHKQVLERMSQQEREAFARDGSLPEWISQANGATSDASHEVEKGSQVLENRSVQ